MFGGYVGQEDDKKRLKELREKLALDPNNKELQDDVNKQDAYNTKRMDSAFQSYCRI